MTKHTPTLSGNPREVPAAAYDTLEDIFDCAVNWISADADNPDTPPEAWQVCFGHVRACVESHDELVAALRDALTFIGPTPGGMAWLDKARAALARASQS